MVRESRAKCAITLVPANLCPADPRREASAKFLRRSLERPQDFPVKRAEAEGDCIIMIASGSAHPT